MNSKTGQPSEFELISKYFAPLAGEGSFGFSDDAAQIKLNEGNSLVITQDAIASGVHFFADDDPNRVAQKAIRVNVSDLVAKGATPKSISLALGLPNNWTEGWVAKFAEGLAADCETFAVTLSGGDTFTTGAGAVVSVTAVGEVPDSQYVSRLGAEPGDLVFVTGAIGDGAFGLAARAGTLEGLHPNEVYYLTDRYLLPQPRIEAINIIREYATASMDISDGLIADCEKLASASGVSMNIQSADVPMSPPVSRLINDESNSLEVALSGGDDYEILFTVHPEKRVDLVNQADELPFAVSCIGEIAEGEGVTVFDRSGLILEVKQTGYDHSRHSS